MSKPGSTWPVRLAERAYRCLLYLYPAEFRRRFGPELLQVCRDAFRDAYRQAGLLGALRVTVRTFVDLVTTATAEQVSIMRQSSYSASRDFFLAGLLMLPVVLMLLVPASQFVAIALLYMLLWLLNSRRVVSAVCPWRRTRRGKPIVLVFVGLTAASVGAALAGGSVAGVDLRWTYAALGAAGTVFCLARRIEIVRDGQRPLGWLLTWIGIYIASGLAGVGADAVLPGSWANAAVLSMTLLCFAAGWVALARGRARA